jgi:hypothetical protein
VVEASEGVQQFDKSYPFQVDHELPRIDLTFRRVKQLLEGGQESPNQRSIRRNFQGQTQKRP